MSISNLLYRLTQRRPMRLIRIDGQPYLERYHIAKIGPIRIWLHHFVREDEERAVHDHPWSALSLILTGGYTEEHIEDSFAFNYRDLKAPRWNWIPWHKQHRIVAVSKDTWTLMLVGPRTGREWHFYDYDMPDGTVTVTPGPSGEKDWHKTAAFRDEVYADLTDKR